MFTYFCISFFSPRNVVVHEDDPVCDVLRFTLQVSHQTLNLLEEAQRCDSWECFPLELRWHTVDSIHILELNVFRISLDFSLPGRNWVIFLFFRVGENVGFGVGELMGLFTQ